MSEEYKVSLIVAVYNSAPFLDKLITSIVNQTYRNIEIILVDDGSPDNSGEICDTYASKDDRISVIHKKNGGTCEARNYGLSVCTGDFIMIIDGDDWLENDCVEYMVKLIKQTNSDMAYSDHVFTTRDRKQIKKDCIETWSPGKAAAMIVYPYMPLGPWNKIYRKSLLDENNITFSVPWFGEGLYFATTAAQHANHVGVGHRKVYNYRLNNSGSGLTTYKVQKGINALKNIYTLKEEQYIKEDILSNAIDWHIWKNYTFLLLQILGTGEIEKYRKFYKDSIVYIRKNCFKVLHRSEISTKEKLKVLLCGLMPIVYTKIVIRKRSNELKKDLME